MANGPSSFHHLQAEPDFFDGFDPRAFSLFGSDPPSPSLRDVIGIPPLDESNFVQSDHQLDHWASRRGDVSLSTFLEDPATGNDWEGAANPHSIAGLADQFLGLSSHHDPATSRELQSDPKLGFGSQAPLHTFLTAPLRQADTDGEDSWNEDMHSGRDSRFIDEVRDQIWSIAPTPGAFIVTYSLSLHERKIVQLLAHLARCSHFSIGTGVSRPVVVVAAGLEAKHEFQSHDTRLKRAPRRWSAKSNFLIDPTRIKIKNIPADLSQAAFEKLVARKKLPDPRFLLYFQFAEYSTREERSLGMAFADFDDPEDVAVFARSLQGCRLRRNDPSGLIIQFVTIRRDGNVYSNMGQTRPVNYKTVFENDMYHRSDTPVPWEESFTYSRRSSDAEDSGHSSAADSGGHSSTSAYTDSSSDISTKKKRKRQPMIPSGYKCRKNGCNKVFDYSGERTKHERIHGPKGERPFACDCCTLRFLDAKDLRRHKATHMKAPNEEAVLDE